MVWATSYIFLPKVSHCYADNVGTTPRNVVMSQQKAEKIPEVAICTSALRKCFMRKGMHFTYLSGLNNSHMHFGEKH